MKVEYQNNSTHNQNQYRLVESQKKIAPAFLVEHQPERPFLKPSPLLALGSLFGFLHPGSVQASGYRLTVFQSRSTRFHYLK